MTNLGRLLRVKVEEETRKICAELGAGMAKDFADYKYMVGMIYGMERTMVFLEELEGKL